MADPKTQRVTVAAVGLAVSVGFVALAFRRLDFASTVHTWRSAHPFPWVPLMVASYLIGHVVRGQRLRVLVRRETILQLPTAANIVVVGYASNNVLPARLGELVRAGILSERTGVPLSQALTVTFIERLLDGIAILILLFVGIHGIGSRPPLIARVAEGGSIVLGIALLVVLLAVFLPTALLTTSARLSTALPPKWRDRIFALALSVTNAGACLRRPRDAAWIVGYSFVVWLFESLMFAFAFPVFSLKLGIASAIVTMAFTNLGILVPASPGFIGSFHFFCATALTSQGIVQATATGYAVLVHLAFFLPVTLWGAGVIFWYGIEVGSAVALARAAKLAPGAVLIDGVPAHMIAGLGSPPLPGHPSEFLVSLTEAMLADREGSLDGPALQEVARFLTEEIHALPPRLRAMFEAGMATFRFYTRIRYLHSFCALDLARRSAAARSWAFGPVGLFRQLFRPVRSVVFLAYYERVAPKESLRVHLPLVDAAFATSQSHE